MNALAEVNSSRLSEVNAFVARYRRERAASASVAFDAYPLPRLEKRITTALSARAGQALDIKFDFIDRAKMGGDLALRFPQLLKDGGPKGFMANHLPWIVEILSGPDFADAIAKLETKGMYINLTLSDGWMLSGAQAVTDIGAHFGDSDALKGRSAVVDYSSPNVAKTLHAGHIRSTIVGHVLSNLWERSGADTFRVNHINDFGGFGFMLEGYRRFGAVFPADFGDNDKLLEIYRIRRSVERILEGAKPSAEWEAEDAAIAGRYFPGATNLDALKAAFGDYVAASDARFRALEQGDAAEVALWIDMVKWSLQSFEGFYDALNIHFDLVLGESFYYQAGDATVEAALQSGKAVIYTEAHAQEAIAIEEARFAAGDIGEIERDTLIKSIRKDIGAAVVLLDNNERFVVRRADGQSIYSTRDMGAIRLRSEMFDPTDTFYVVGQEQQVHFNRLFRSAYVTGIADPARTTFQHVYFGFYVDAQTGKKLSSRQSVSNVIGLLSAAQVYFRNRLSDRVDSDEAELSRAAQELAIGSIVFNDLKQDLKGAVEIDASDMDATIAGFERSGGAYVVYAACRARSILRKNGGGVAKLDGLNPEFNYQIDAQEADLLLKVQQIPQKVVAAAKAANPSVLVRHLMDVAAIYNSYYTRVPVISDGVANPARLVITQAVQVALTRALSICHIECPEAI
ncbi:arginine--tRNA ligase [Asticcacaulis sp. AND118]|uniref:arginine--tRNA ligase domain-containing protein n=1 Tax=Asticcacaulis sp. AND118 TaxID=2840468 RepID=UPI001D0001D9|nr:arginine--tRNA ligase [Asticcacaulis sp. AND118]UDF04115.1 arginine--tRNA ligase [Asticcacaulis sp. AND118]